MSNRLLAPPCGVQQVLPSRFFISRFPIDAREFRVYDETSSVHIENARARWPISPVPPFPRIVLKEEQRQPREKTVRIPFLLGAGMTPPHERLRNSWAI